MVQCMDLLVPFEVRVEGVDDDSVSRFRVRDIILSISMEETRRAVSQDTVSCRRGRTVERTAKYQFSWPSTTTTPATTIPTKTTSTATTRTTTTSNITTISTNTAKYTTTITSTNTAPATTTTTTKSNYQRLPSGSLTRGPSATSQPNDDRWKREGSPSNRSSSRRSTASQPTTTTTTQRYGC